MSATVDAEKISSYFGNCETLQVPGRTFPVDVQYLEDAIEYSKWSITENSPYAKRRAYQDSICLSLFVVFDHSITQFTTSITRVKIDPNGQKIYQALMKRTTIQAMAKAQVLS